MKKTLLISLICTVGFVLCLALFIILNDFHLTIQLDPSTTKILEYGDTFQQEEPAVFLEGSAIIPVKISLQDCQPFLRNTVQEDILGIQTVIYEAEFLYWKGTAEQTVQVIDTQCPVIELKTASEDLFSEDGKYEDPGFSASDNYDGDITDRIIRMEKPGLITYAVVDSSGNPAYVQREIPYYDTIPPVIELEGGQEYTITVGTFYEEPGFSAMDDSDGDMTELVEVQGEVDWLTPGVYPVEYVVSDTCENQTSVTRNVTVEAIPWPDTQWPNSRTIYLTFDDGPGPYTAALLNVLDRYGVKATFFVVDSGYDAMMGEIVRRGHSIGIHSVSHDYSKIYASPEAYFEDLYGMQEIIYQNTGVKTTLLRFPGGGSNLVSKNASKGIMTILTKAVRDAGFQYFDWNVDSDDAGAARKTEKVRDNVVEGIRATGTSIVLQHDIHAYSVEAVEDIILWGMENGYRFAAITPSTPGFHHDVLN